MNKVFLIGRLTHDLNLKKTQTGKSVLNFTIAAEEKGDTEFIYCTAWEKLAELINTYCYKGFMLGLTGTLKRKEYTNKNGDKRHEVEVMVENVQFLTPKRSTQAQNTYNPYNEPIEPDMTQYGQEYDPSQDFGPMFPRY